MSLVSTTEILDYLGNPTGEDETNALAVHISMENWVKNYLRKDIGLTTYTLERYDGTGTRHLYLNNYPVVTLTRLSIGFWDVITVKNTANSTFATTSVSDTGVTLTRNGLTDGTLTFAQYATMSTMAAAITAAGNGWSASVLDSRFAAYQSTSLLPRYGANCNDQMSVWLQMPDPYTYRDFDVSPGKGIITLLSSVFPQGENNVFVSYTAGYSDVPEEIKLAIKIGVKSLYKKETDELYGVESYKIENIAVTYSKGGFPKNGVASVPSETLELLSKYRRYLV